MHATASQIPIEHQNGGTPETNSMPTMLPGQKLELSRIRARGETFFLACIYLVDALLLSAITSIVGLGLSSGWNVLDFISLLPFFLILAFFALATYISWKFAYWSVFGNSVAVTETQYPHIYRIVKQAADFLQIPMPTVLVFHGAGWLEMLVVKQFTRRGLLLVTSDLIDAISESATSRELMMIIGRQLGHIKMGHFKWWFFKDVIGRAALFFHAAYWRRCHVTADRIGLLMAGDLYAAEQALLILTVGEKLAPGTNIDQIAEQKTQLHESWWAIIKLIFSEYPYMLDRLTELRNFAAELGVSNKASETTQLGAIPLSHRKLAMIPIMLIHGHDKLALLEVKDFLFTNFPNVRPIVMAIEGMAASTLPEKLEILASQSRGAIALLTPDDRIPVTGSPTLVEGRARQNVIMEIGWFWGRLGRHRCLLLSRGKVEMPSDLSGCEYFTFRTSAAECSEAIRDFVASLEKAPHPQSLEYFSSGRAISLNNGAIA